MELTQLNQILDQLSTLGADREEIEFWRAVYSAWPDERKQILDKNFLGELALLKETE